MPTIAFRENSSPNHSLISGPHDVIPSHADKVDDLSGQLYRLLLGYHFPQVALLIESLPAQVMMIPIAMKASIHLFRCTVPILPPFSLFSRPENERYRCRQNHYDDEQTDRVHVTPFTC